MKCIFVLTVGLALLFSLTACDTNGNSQRSEETIPVTSTLSQAGSGGQADMDGTTSPVETESREQPKADRQIQITAREGNQIVFQLNNSPAADSFYQQLPLSIWIEDYAGSEKIFYPPEEVDTGNTPLAQGPAGTLAYYAPWGNIAVFYGECDGGGGLYELGEAVSGAEWIEELSGEIQIEVLGAVSPPMEPVESIGTPPVTAESSEWINTPTPTSEPVELTSMSSQSKEPPETSSVEKPALQEPEREAGVKESTAVKMNIQIGNTMFQAVLEDNIAVYSLIQQMKTAPVSIQMRDYSGFEKVGSLGTSLPASDKQTTTRPGDIVLYNGNQIVLFYGSNSWSYTRLGKIDDLSGWEEALGNGDVTVTFSLE